MLYGSYFLLPIFQCWSSAVQTYGPTVYVPVPPAARARLGGWARQYFIVIVNWSLGGAIGIRDEDLQNARLPPVEWQDSPSGCPQGPGLCCHTGRSGVVNDLLS